MIKTILTYAMFILASFFFLAPLLVMIGGSLKPDELVLLEAGSWRALLPEDISLQNFADVFRRVEFGGYMVNSLLITGTIVVAGLVVNSMAGYALARLRWRGRSIALGFVLAMLIVPFEAIAVPLFYGASMLGLRDTYTVQIIPFIANAFSIYLFYTFFIGLPHELEEAARIDGAGLLRTFTAIVIPNAGPAFATVAILTFLVHWGSFLWPLMVTIGEDVRPLPVAIATFQTLPPIQWGDIMAFGVMMVAPVLVIFLLFQRWFVEGVASTGVKG